MLVLDITSQKNELMPSLRMPELVEHEYHRFLSYVLKNSCGKRYEARSKNPN